MIILFYTIDTLGRIHDLQPNPVKIAERATHLDFVKNIEIINEIVQSFKKLPKWDPALMREKKIKFQFMQMIRFPYEYKCISN